MFEIRKQFEFAAGHQLDHLPQGHKCANQHGHNYIVEIVLQRETLNGDGFVIDYGDLRPLKDHIDQKFDHSYLNDWFPGYTTAENIAQYLYAWAHAYWPETVAVRVSETPKTWAEYRPGPKEKGMPLQTQRPDSDAIQRRRKIMRLSRREMFQILAGRIAIDVGALPPDTAIVEVHSDFQSQDFVLLLWSYSFEDVEPGMEPPTIPTTVEKLP